ncbi:competence pheromone ComX [Gracilibacillus marinus]|jgi:competence protein ComX|uniref:ComX pheromone n=1 Tax=Gracilibacillus marinus TaxID=630535 RepID=A0ABV8VTN9_9BACI
MQQIIQFLINNGDVLSKVKEGKASLVGVSSEEQKAIVEVFFEQHDNLDSYYYWQ